MLHVSRVSGTMGAFSTGLETFVFGLSVCQLSFEILELSFEILDDPGLCLNKFPKLGLSFWIPSSNSDALGHGAAASRCQP